jgi:hypothetical protein
LLIVLPSAGSLRSSARASALTLSRPGGHAILVTRSHRHPPILSLARRAHELHAFEDEKFANKREVNGLAGPGTM